MPSRITNENTTRAAGASHRHQTNAVVRLQMEALETLKANKTPPPMVARAMSYVNSVIAEVYRRDSDMSSAASEAKKAVDDFFSGLQGKKKSGFHPVAKMFLEQAQKDNAANATQVPVEASDPMRNTWTTKNEAGNTIKGLLPGFGNVTPRVAENRNISAESPRFTDADWNRFFEAYKNRTGEQIQAAKYWADGPGTYTPPGHWNLIMQDACKAVGFTVHEAAALGKALNDALFDAGVSCWKTKYRHMGERPFQAAQRLGVDFNPEIKTPPFPGYTSGHATFSGAAAEVLGRTIDEKGLNPRLLAALRNTLLGKAQVSETKESIRNAQNATDMFQALALEAANSRVWGGIHIVDDGLAGLEVGKKIGRNVLSAKRL